MKKSGNFTYLGLADALASWYNEGRKRFARDNLRRGRRAIMRLSELIKYENNEVRLNTIKNHKRNIVPFIGAGVSCGCGLLTWYELLEELAKDYFSQQEIKKLSELAAIEFVDEIVKKAGNISAIAHRISEIFASREINISDVPYILLEEFSPLIVTTNYDDIIEQASTKVPRGKIAALLPCLRGQFSSAIQLNEYKLLKIHGSIEESTSFVISSQQYDAAYRENGLVESYLRNIFSGKRVFFVGCSLEEDRTLEILKKCVEKNKELVHYAINPRPEEEKDYLQRNAHLMSLGIYPIYFPQNDYGAISKLLNYIAEENKFAKAIRVYITEITDIKDDSNIKVLYSILSETFYEVANKYEELYNIDYSLIDIKAYMKMYAWKYISQKLEFRLLDLCINGFVAYLRLANINNSNKEDVTNYFRKILFNKFLEETDIVDYLHKNDFSKEHIIGKVSGDQLIGLSDIQVNQLASRQISILNYRGNMSFDLTGEYELAERINDYCSNKLNFNNKIKLLRALGAFGCFYKKNNAAKIYLQECIDILEQSGRNSSDDIMFLSQVYNNLAIVEAYTPGHLQEALDMNQRDIELKKKCNEQGTLLARSLNLRATIYKEVNPFKALDVYIECCKIKEELYRECKDDCEKEDLLISWMLSAFNVGLLAKDIYLYEDAYRIILKANEIRLQKLNKCSKDYCSSINVQAELEILLFGEIQSSEIVRAIKSRIDLPQDFTETLQHTWYICALNCYCQKNYTLALKYINKALLKMEENNQFYDLRQEVRIYILIGNIKFEIAKMGEGKYEDAERNYLIAKQKLIGEYGENSVYLKGIYECLVARFGDKYLTEYTQINKLYSEDIEETENKIRQFEFGEI